MGEGYPPIYIAQIDEKGDGDAARDERFTSYANKAGATMGLLETQPESSDARCLAPGQPNRDLPGVSGWRMRDPRRRSAADPAEKEDLVVYRQDL